MTIIMMMIFFVDYTAAETCTDDGDCRNTMCDSAHDLECHRGQCTCVNHVQSKLIQKVVVKER